jgi:hypothetical protein
MAESIAGIAAARVTHRPQAQDGEVSPLRFDYSNMVAQATIPGLPEAPANNSIGRGRAGRQDVVMEEPMTAEVTVTLEPKVER